MKPEEYRDAWFDFAEQLATRPTARSVRGGPSSYMLRGPSFPDINVDLFDQPSRGGLHPYDVELLLTLIEAYVRENWLHLISFPNVVGVGPSFKLREGQVLRQPCLTFFVSEKVPDGDIDPGGRIIPERMGGFEVDVVEAGDAFASTAAGGSPSVQGGGSISPSTLQSTGTLGAIVEDASTGDKLLLSNNHVLAGWNKVPLKTAVMQPGHADSGTTPADDIGELDRFHPVVIGAGAANLVDAAAARPTAGASLLHSFKPPSGSRQLPAGAVGRAVEKVGWMTNHTSGVVVSTGGVVRVVDPAVGVIQFQDTIVTTVQVDPGDSGSVLLDTRSGAATGLVFGQFTLAGQSSFSYANDIKNVEKLLNVRVP